MHGEDSRIAQRLEGNTLYWEIGSAWSSAVVSLVAEGNYGNCAVLAQNSDGGRIATAVE
jgi:hypothetical protein